MNETESELIILLKDFVKENKEDKKETAKCLADLKKQFSDMNTRMVKIESLCENAKDLRETCFVRQRDIENRMRIVETVVVGVKDLPQDFKKLAKQVYLTAGAMTLIIILAGIWIKGFGA